MIPSKAITCDVEVLPNYFLIMFLDVKSGAVLYFDKIVDGEKQLDTNSILHILEKYEIITFNGYRYDILMVEAALMGFSCSSLKSLSDDIVENNQQPWQVRKQYGFNALKINTIDLINVCPLKASLKIYGGRLHFKQLQEMPVEHTESITQEQVPMVRNYCEIDNNVTATVYNHLHEEIDLRRNLGQKYDLDLRSKSDAQIAEAIFKSELKRRYDINAKRPKIPVGTEFYYKAPDNLVFNSSLLQDVLRQYQENPITLGKSNKCEFFFDNGKKKLPITIGKMKYTLGIGGIHSTEKSTRHVAEDGYIIKDLDVASFYPFIILINKLMPSHIGEPFLEIFREIVYDRLAAKRAGNHVVNESLKIVINGTFGKLGEKWSCIFAPDLMAQVTITGQLFTLMLIEMLEEAGIQVISANTDGIVIKYEKYLDSAVTDLTEEWMWDTDYVLEGTEYTSLNSRDVNNYIAIKAKDIDHNIPYSDNTWGVKGKGAYADKNNHFYSLRSNPTTDICAVAAKQFLVAGVAPERTVKACEDIRMFVTLRTVNGGAVHHGKKIGKAIRWYYGKEELDAIFYAKTGNKVPLTEGAVPLMNLPETVPNDLDYNWYIQESYRILKDVGYKI